MCAFVWCGAQNVAHGCIRPSHSVYISSVFCDGSQWLIDNHSVRTHTKCTRMEYIVVCDQSLVYRPNVVRSHCHVVSWTSQLLLLLLLLILILVVGVRGACICGPGIFAPNNSSNQKMKKIEPEKRYNGRTMGEQCQTVTAINDDGYESMPFRLSERPPNVFRAPIGFWFW